MEANERPQLIRSINNDHFAKVIFNNCTRYEVELLWINYEGQAVSYGKLPPGGYQKMSTFATHPWIAIEPLTMDRFLIGGKIVYYPEPWCEKNRHLPRSQMPREIVSDNVSISLPMYSLRDRALRVIKQYLFDDNDAYYLDIPMNLQHMLATMNPRKKRRL